MGSRIQPYSEAHRSYEESVSVSKSVVPYLILCLLVLGGLLPFASRAVYLDEPQILHIAQSAINHNWLFPQDAPWTFFGKRYPNMNGQTHLPLVDYYLAILIKALGRFDGWKLRILFAVFPMMAVFSFYRIARRFTAHPLIVASLFAVSPAFFVFIPTLMLDIPMLAFLLAGLSVHLDGIESGKRLWLASACFIVATGTAYTAWIPLGCLFLWTAVNRRPWREWLALAAVPTAIGIWLAILTAHFGKSPTTELVRSYPVHFSLSLLALPMLSFIGGVAVFPWLFLAAIKANRLWYIALSAAGAFAASLFHSWPSLSYRLWFVFFASSGIALLAMFAVKSAEGTKHKASGYGVLILWLPVSLAFLLLFPDMMAARYILLALPPVFLVVFNDISPSTGVYVIGITAFLSISLAVADYRMVNAYPQWVYQYVVPLQKDGFHIWNASESGLRFYLEEQGVQTLSESDIRPKGSDLVIRQESFTYGLSQDLAPLLINIFHTNLQDAYPIRTFSRDAGAGFHDSHFGVVPYIISREPLDHLSVAEVSPFVISLPEDVPKDFSSVPVWFPGGVLLKQTTPEMAFHVPIPDGSDIRYQLEGKGRVVISDNSIYLEKDSPEPILWKNFRIVPSRFE